MPRFTPTGQDAPGAPYEGGGLYGAGYGITLDPDGNVWVGNFGFQGSNCPLDLMELSKSVSKFSGEGVALSPDATDDDPGGFMGAGNTINQPRGLCLTGTVIYGLQTAVAGVLLSFREETPTLLLRLPPLMKLILNYL